MAVVLPSSSPSPKNIFYPRIKNKNTVPHVAAQAFLSRREKMTLPL